MTPKELKDARGSLGTAWGLRRPVSSSEMARLLRLKSGKGDDTILGYEAGKGTISGPMSLAIEMMLEPDDAVIDAARRAAAEIDVGGGQTLGALLAARGDAADDVLEDLVLRLSDILRTPPSKAEALGEGARVPSSSERRRFAPNQPTDHIPIVGRRHTSAS